MLKPARETFKGWEKVQEESMEGSFRTGGVKQVKAGTDPANLRVSPHDPSPLQDEDSDGICPEQRVTRKGGTAYMTPFTE